MSDTPTTTNPTATAVNVVISDAVGAGEKIADAAAEAALEGAVPFFNLPVIKQITDAFIEEVVSLVGKEISVGFQQVGTFLVIDTQINSETNGVSQALANLMIAEKSGNAAQIQAAIQAYANAQSALVHDDGSAPPIT